MNTISISVGTTNLDKVSAILEAFRRYFEESFINIKGYSVNSHVPEQPINEDVYKGAENRLQCLKEIVEDYDFLVGCEGGLICQYGHWFNVQVIAIEDQHGKRGFGMSQGYEIPNKYIKEVIETNMADTLDRIFRGKGGIRVLTQNHFTRSKLIEDGTVMALTRVINGKMW